MNSKEGWNAQLDENIVQGLQNKEDMRNGEPLYGSDEWERIERIVEKSIFECDDKWVSNEICASVLGDFSRYCIKHGIELTDDSPVVHKTMELVVVKDRILQAKTCEELDKINGQARAAKEWLAALANGDEF